MINETEIITDAATAYDAERNPEIVCYLLRRQENSSNFENLLQVTSGFWSKWNKYREQTEFKFYTTDENFSDKFAIATEIAYGIPQSGKIDVFTIEDDQKDKVKPSGANLAYKAFGNRDAKVRFEP